MNLLCLTLSSIKALYKSMRTLISESEYFVHVFELNKMIFDENVVNSSPFIYKYKVNVTDVDEVF